MNVGPSQLAWLKPELTRPLGLVEDTVLIATPNAFVKEQLETRLRPLVIHALSRELGRPIQLAVTVDPRPTSPQDPPSGPPSSPLSVIDQPGGHMSAMSPPMHPGMPQESPQGEWGAAASHAGDQQQQSQPQAQPQPEQYLYESTGWPSQGAQEMQPEQLSFNRPSQPSPPHQHESSDLAGMPSPDQQSRPHSQHGQQGQGRPGQSGQQHEQPLRPASARLNSKYTFETFVIGSSNRFAHAAAVAVAEAPAKAYNPLFIYGDSGLGKTHLLHAIGHYAQTLYNGIKVRYMSSEEFTNDFINMIRDGKQDGFRRRYRDVDVLLVDDIQFLENKEGTQEEFFHTFNTLHNASKQIVISSDRAPKRLVTLEDR